MRLVAHCSNYLFYYCSQCAPLCLALSSVPTIAMAKDLKWPKNGAQLLISCCLFVFGSVLYNDACYGDQTSTWFIANIFIIYLLPMFLYIMISLSWMLPSLILSSCKEKFISLCEHKAFTDSILHSAKCLKKYSDLFLLFLEFLNCYPF